MNTFRRVAVVAASAGALSSGIAIAQIAPPTGDTGKSSAADGSTGDIVVTARRRDESLSKTPVSVAVVSSDGLAKAQITSEQDLRFATPGLSVRTGLSSQNLNYAIRGQSQDPYSNSRPGVLPYINEVQIGGQGAATAFYDLQSVQVLKGPQGTLFGRSATGGAVLFTTAKPTEELSGYVSGLAGDYGALKAEGAIGGAIVGDTLLGRVAGFYDRRHGFQKNLFTGRRQGDYDRYGFRGSLTAHIGTVRNDLVTDYFHADGETMAAVTAGLYPMAFLPSSLLYAGVATPQDRATGIGTISAFTGAPASVVAPFYDAYFANPKHPRSLLAEVAAQQGRGPYIINNDVPNTFRTKNLIITNTTSVDISDTAQVKNIFGYTKLAQDVQNDADGTPFLLSGAASGTCTCNDIRQVSDELQLLGESFGGSFEYVVGAYFSNERSTQKLANSPFDILLGGFHQQLDNVTKNLTYAPYAQGTYKFGDSGLSATVGLRYTSEKVTRVTLPTDTNRLALGEPAPAGYDYDKSATFKKLSWTFGLQYQANSNLLLYAASHRAYKSGGFNVLQPPLNGSGKTGGDAFGAEKIVDAEFGAKFDGRIGDLPMRMNLALFHNWVSNSQRAAYVIITGPAVVTVNVPKIRIYGLEFDNVVQPASWLTLGANMNYTHSKVADGTVFAGGMPVIYDQVADTPKFSGAIYADVQVPVAKSLSVLLHGDAYRQLKSFTSSRSINSFGTILDPYTLVNFRVGLQSDQAGWSLTANLKNAFNKLYYVGGVATGESYELNFLVPGNPRTFTVEARFKF